MSEFAKLEAAISKWVPDGFRGDDGVWHEGPHRAAAFAALDSLKERLDSLKEQVDCCAADTTAIELRQEIEFMKAEARLRRHRVMRRLLARVAGRTSA